METADDWIDLETWNRGLDVELASLAKWRRECERKFSPPPKPPSVWCKVGEGIKWMLIWFALLGTYFCILMAAIFWSCRHAAQRHSQADSYNFARMESEEHLL